MLNLWKVVVEISKALNWAKTIPLAVENYKYVVEYKCYCSNNSRAWRSSIKTIAINQFCKILKWQVDNAG